MNTTTLAQPVNDTKSPIPKDSLALNAPQKALIAGGAIAALLLLIHLLTTQHISQSLLLGIGLLLGYTLFHARFGFTSAFRRIMAVSNGQAMRSHMLMLAVAVTLFAPILAFGTTLFGGEVSGYVTPLGVSLLVGSFVFGIGMQLGGGCASGTLYSIGGGRSVMFITFIFFIVGATIGAHHLPFWTEEMPAYAPYSLATSTGLGYTGAWLLSLALFGLIAWITLVVEKKKTHLKWHPCRLRLVGNEFFVVRGHCLLRRSLWRYLMP